jgi:hypothetical protein
MATEEYDTYLWGDETYYVICHECGERMYAGEPAHVIDIDEGRDMTFFHPHHNRL